MHNSIKILGCHGGKAKDIGLTSILVSNDTVIDAGNLIDSLGENAKFIDNILLTHAHFDHLNDIPYLIDKYFEFRKKPLKIYGTKGTIKIIKQHIFNNLIWPDFSKINLINSKEFAMEFIEINIGETLSFNETLLKPINNNHTNSSCGYVITKNNRSILFTSDTYCSDDILKELNTNLSIFTMIIDISFPSRLKKLAYDSKHLTIELLKDELSKVSRTDIIIYLNHLKPQYLDEILKEVNSSIEILNGGKVLEEQDELSFDNE